MAKSTITPEPRSAQEKSFPPRQLKVRKGHYYYQTGQFDPLRPHATPAPVPWIQIKGYWLNRAGFAIGTSIRVKVRQGCLALRAIQDSVS